MAKSKNPKSRFEVINKMMDGDRRSLARVISLIEDRGQELREIVDEVYPHTGNSFVIGITGPPGAGKSTVTGKLISEIRKKTGKKVAVIAIDPSSPFSGGAILGDRIRMQAHFNDPDVYIRSLGTRGKHGGLSQSSKEVVMALDAAGYEWIIVETAGVGQTELDVLRLAHAVSVVLVPESGDGIQVMKAGLMEIADLFIVNKSDRPEADKLVKELLTLIQMNEKHHEDKEQWKIPVIKTQAIFDQGIDEFFAQLDTFRVSAEKFGWIKNKREAFIKDEITEIITNQITQRIHAFMAEKDGEESIRSVLQLTETPYKSADFFLSKILDQKKLK